MGHAAGHATKTRHGARHGHVTTAPRGRMVLPGVGGAAPLGGLQRSGAVCEPLDAGVCAVTLAFAVSAVIPGVGDVSLMCP